METSNSAPSSSPCPHCGLPAVLPEVCTPAIHEALERLIAKDWALYDAAWTHGQQCAKQDAAECASSSPWSEQC